jgi:hydroxypyruvate reductase
MEHQITEKDELNRFLTYSCKSSNWGLKAARILNSALSAVDPFSAVMKGLENPKFFSGVEKGINSFSDYRNIQLIGAGKAAQPMAEAAQEYFREKISSGIILVKDGYTKNAVLSGRIKIFEASHPIPDQRGINATQEIINLLQKTSKDDLVICLFSGGGSALMNNPVPGISLADIQQLTELLLVSGATINEINTLRKHLDQVKGGQIARLAAPAQVLCLILSDVVGDPLDVIASGPTVPDPTTFQDSIDILKRCAIYELVPGTIRTHFDLGRQGKVAETPKPGEETFNNVCNIVVGSNQTATQAALAQAKIEGFNSFCLTNYLQGEASQVGTYLGSILRQLALHDQPIPRPACIIVGGETTVTIKGDGMGGRNQELALGSVSELDGLENVALITLATDGGDGLSDAAGAVVTGETYSRAYSLNLDPRDFLSTNDSHNFFLPLGDLLNIGPTRTNVNDLTFLFAF